MDDNHPPAAARPASTSGSCARSASLLAAVGLALIIVVGLPLSLLAASWAAVFFDPERMTQAVARQLLDSGVFRQLAGDALLRAEHGPDGGEARAFQSLDEAGRQQALDILIPRGWALDQLQRVMHDLYAWFDDDQPLPKLTLDIGPIKERLMSGGALELAILLLESWPPCGALQQAELSQGRSGWEELQCSPPEPLRSALIEQVAQQLQRDVRPLPSVVPLGEQAGGQDPQQAARLKQGIRLVRALARWGWLLPLSALGLITAVAVRSWPQLLGWWGAPLAGAGAGGLFLLLGAGSLARRLSLRVTSQSQLPPVLDQALLAVGDQLLGDILRMLLVESIVLALLGGAMWGTGRYLGRRVRAAA